ncbi:7-carboxy-7-deazaguanine synthase QueE [Actinocatenispora comari]|uniref:7-carboxy-7-deazaguanine synthase n=1 Tax=Actinocatenispora comari TaxID=2807577 RepID=A0A8J4AD15_9ACTN|nr:7-carboxy-7-deazaguanine synthase QueE [Actinocatenispora comari]GIL29056.1 radical SAM protein [Actinocatenispora comari]
MTAATVQPLLVAETFGPTVQGEGPSCGQQALFVRLSRCNLSCPACDTPYTWDTTRFDLRAESTRRRADDVASWVLSNSARLVVVTGGEPLLQQEQLLPMVTRLAEHGRKVEVETNGTIAPSPALAEAVSAFNVSVKLAGFAADRDRNRRINPSAINALAASGKAVWKFVVSTVDDLGEIAELQHIYGLDPIWVMPEGTTSRVVIDRARRIADEVITLGWNLTPRLHVLLWGDQRGR